MLAAPSRRSPGKFRVPRTIAGALLFIAVIGSPTLRAAEHTLTPSPQTVHVGYFLSSLKPVLTIDSGDIVTIETAPALDPAIIDQSGTVPASAVPQFVRDIFREVKDRGPAFHVLTGPIEIRGAMPGDVLELHILEVNLAVP